MIKLLIGGSPCTYWSIAQHRSREIRAEGEGWELFKNYLLAKEKFKPDFFLYENNKSAAQPIKDQISSELGVELVYINSALVSAQNRERFYAFNWRVEQPMDRMIRIEDILQKTVPSSLIFPLNVTLSGKAKCIRASCYKDGIRNLIGNTVDLRTCVAECISNDAAEGKGIYDVYGGMVNLGGRLYPCEVPDGRYLIRKLTPTECERLQTLPDGYTQAVSATQRYRGLGNGWTAEVIIHILTGALKDVPRGEEITVLSMYDGIGTGRYCLDKMGFTNVAYYAYEIDKPAMTVALSNYPDIIQLGDAFEVRKDDWGIRKSFDG